MLYEAVGEASSRPAFGIEVLDHPERRSASRPPLHNNASVAAGAVAMLPVKQLVSLTVEILTSIPSATALPGTSTARDRPPG
jgi:hypothetical protein